MLLGWGVIPLGVLLFCIIPILRGVHSILLSSGVIPQGGYFILSSSGVDVLGIYCLWGVILYFSPPEYNSAWGMIHLGGYSILLSSGVIVLGFFSPGGLLCIIPLRCYCALGLFSWGVVLHYSSPGLLCWGLIPLGPGGLLCMNLYTAPKGQ